MLKRIKARNFLSLKDIDLELSLRNVLVGPNMSGKSNLIECLRFIRDATGRRISPGRAAVQEAVSQRGGFDEVVWKGQPQGVIGFELVVQLADTKNHSPVVYHYDFSLRRGQYQDFEVESEKLTVKRGGAVKPLIENAGGKLKVMRRGQSSDGPQSRLNLALEQFGPNPDEESYSFWNFVQNWRFYHLVPALMRQSNPPSWENHLAEHGENLSVWLLTLQNYREEFNSIKQACRDVLPAVAELIFQPVEPQRTVVPSESGVTSITLEPSRISVGVGEADFKKPIALSRMSDGELAFLALLSLILAPEELTPSLLCIEEPENHLHPALLEILVELVNQRQLQPGAPQIVATTHSPFLVDKLTIDDLIITERADGSTRFSRPSSKKYLKKLLSDKELGLGDLWYSGALGSS